MQLTSLSLALTRAGFLSVAAFSPASLFASSEQGVWYEPSLTNGTCFQDAAGTTPVTAVEQPVGLMLDKSKGLVLGPELVDTANTAAAWVPFGSNTVTQIANGVVIQGVNDARYASLGLTQSGGLSVNLVVGKTYELSFSAFVNASNATMTAANAGAGSVAITTTPQNFTLRIVPQNAFSSFTLGSPSASLTITVTNISVREIPGNHATQTTSTSRPVLSARYNLLTKTEQFDDAVWVKSGATVTANTTATIDPLGGNTADLLYPLSTGSNRFIYQVLAVNAALTRSVYAKAAGKSVFYIDLTGAGTQHAFFDLSNGTVGSVQSGYTASIESVGNGWYKCSVSNATAISSSFGGVYGVADANGSTAVTANGTDGIYIWGASLVPANQASLPYQRVNTATDYDADPSKFKPYLRFDGVDDWLVTPTITPGIDKVQVFAGVRKQINYLGSEFGILLEFSTNVDSGANSGVFRIIANGTSGFNLGYNFDSRGTLQAAANLSFAQSPAPQTLISSGLGDISGDSAILRVNGAQAAQSTADQGTGNYLAYQLYIGRRSGATLLFNGNIYGLIVRFGANLPTGTIASTETWLNQKTGAY